MRPSPEQEERQRIQAAEKAKAARDASEDYQQAVLGGIQAAVLRIEEFASKLPSVQRSRRAKATKRLKEIQREGEGEGGVGKNNEETSHTSKSDEISSENMDSRGPAGNVTTEKHYENVNEELKDIKALLAKPVVLDEAFLASNAANSIRGVLAPTTNHDVTRARMALTAAQQKARQEASLAVLKTVDPMMVAVNPLLGAAAGNEAAAALLRCTTVSETEAFTQRGHAAAILLQRHREDVAEKSSKDNESDDGDEGDERPGNLGEQDSPENDVVSQEGHSDIKYSKTLRRRGNSGKRIKSDAGQDAQKVNGSHGDVYVDDDEDFNRDCPPSRSVASRHNEGSCGDDDSESEMEVKLQRHKNKKKSSRHKHRQRHWRSRSRSPERHLSDRDQEVDHVSGHRDRNSEERERDRDHGRGRLGRSRDRSARRI